MSKKPTPFQLRFQELKDELIKEYNSGSSLDAIAIKYKMNLHTLYTYLKLSVTMRKPGVKRMICPVCNSHVHLRNRKTYSENLEKNGIHDVS